MKSQADAIVGMDLVSDEGFVTRDAIISAYQLLLDRLPESEETIQNYISRRWKLSELRQAFIGSKEYKDKNNTGTLHSPLDWPAERVQTDVSARQASAMLAHVAGSWKALGEAEPHWSVLTSERFRPENIAEFEKEFYNSGELSVTFFTRAAERAGLDLSRLKTCFELGCGVGRVTLWLSRLFKHVNGYDISEPHLEIAREMASRANMKNVDYKRLASLDDIDRAEPFDCFYSVIVLQHNPPPIMKMLLERILDKLNPGGVAYFQVPTYSLNYEFAADEYLANVKTEGRMEVHVLPQQTLFEIIDDAGCKLLEIREDGWSGSPRILSNSVLIQKRA